MGRLLALTVLMLPPGIAAAQPAPYVSTAAPEREKERVLACAMPEGRYGGFTCETVPMEMRVRIAYLHCLRDLPGCPKGLLPAAERQDVDFRACVAAIEAARGEAACDHSRLDGMQVAALTRIARRVVASDRAQAQARDRAQQDRRQRQRQTNFERCVDPGGTTGPCDRSLLDAAQRRRVDAAGRQRQAKACLGRPATCDPAALPPETRALVEEAHAARERAARIAAEEKAVRDSEARARRAQNLAHCTEQTGPCDLDLLTLEELARLVELDQARRAKWRDAQAP